MYLKDLGAPPKAVAVVLAAMREAAVTCQTCPSPGRKRVVGESDCAIPWVKTCCDACYALATPPNGHEYEALVAEYEDPSGLRPFW